MNFYVGKQTQFGSGTIQTINIIDINNVIKLILLILYNYGMARVQYENLFAQENSY